MAFDSPATDPLPNAPETGLNATVLALAAAFGAVALAGVAAAALASALPG